MLPASAAVQPYASGRLVIRPRGAAARRIPPRTAAEPTLSERRHTRISVARIALAVGPGRVPDHPTIDRQSLPVGRFGLSGLWFSFSVWNLYIYFGFGFGRSGSRFLAGSWSRGKTKTTRTPWASWRIDSGEHAYIINLKALRAYLLKVRCF